MENKDEDLKRALNDLFNDNNIDNLLESKDTDLLEDNNEVSTNDYILKTKDSNLKNSDIEEKQINEKNNLEFKKIIVYIVFGFIIGVIILLLIINKQEIKKDVINCAYSKENNEYKETSEYKITKKDDLITFVEGSYTYVIKANKYSSNIEKLKLEKMPVIINSNGMSGFTYTYEVSDNSLKINTYLNYEKFKDEEIKAVLQLEKPISFFTIDLQKKYSKLKITLEKNGFKCITSN